MYMAKKVKRLFFISNPRTIVVSTDVTYLAVFTEVVGIEDNGVSGIYIFPNPTNDILNITFSEIIFEIEIVNALGQVVKRLEVNADNAVCDVEDLTSGVYVVRIYYFDTSTNSVHRRLSERFEQKKFVKE
ncbi:MAG: T9SS type A sorting domain-containing protein, partial [Bacteroidales bacterium]|nr:T9SS type A sorting domain-containing protein [Bacteroidales bacterium]